MYKGLLSIIAVCLVMITAKLYVPQVQAEIDYSKEEIESIIEDCQVTGDGLGTDYHPILWRGKIQC